MTGSEIAMSRQAVCKFENISPGHRGLKFYLSSGELDVKVKFICRDHIFCVEYFAFFYPFPGLATSNKRVSVPCWGHNPAYKRTRRTCLLYISKHCKLTVFVHFAFVACCCSHRNRLLESVTSGSAEFLKTSLFANIRRVHFAAR